MVKVDIVAVTFEEDFFPMATQMGVGKKKKAMIHNCLIRKARV
jgi:hypothetical protein